MKLIAIASLLLLAYAIEARSEGAFVVKPPGRLTVDLMEVRAKPDISISNDPGWHDRVITLFEEVVLYDEAKRWRGVNKWSNPIDLSIRGDAAEDFEPYVRTLAAELAELIELPITPFITQDANWSSIGDIDIFITYEKSFRPFPLSRKSSIGSVFTCALLPRIDRGRIRRASILINAGVLDDATSRACLLEELTQSLGLFGETERETATILHDGIGYEGLGAIDHLLIRMLYDPRVVTGVRSATTLATVSDVLDELLAEVRNTSADADINQDWCCLEQDR
jgi:hypothetical protein